MSFYFLLLGSGNSQPMEITIDIKVFPPFTPKLYDYLKPNKIIATVRNISSVQKNIYFLGEIRGGNVNIYTEPTYKPFLPLTIEAGGLVILTGPDIENVLNPKHLIIEGIDKDDILRDNLPEETYTACFTAYDHTSFTPKPISERSCSNPLSVIAIEPPVIISPLCDQEIQGRNPQFINFVWTRPPGSSTNIEYKLQIFEVLPAGRNPKDAVNSANNIFFEKSWRTNSYIYGPADPGLINDRQYAFLITAIDPSGKTLFRNSGKSEICSFVYKSNTVLENILPKFHCDTCLYPGEKLYQDSSGNCVLAENDALKIHYDNKTATNILSGSIVELIVNGTNSNVKLEPLIKCANTELKLKPSYQYTLVYVPSNKTIFNSVFMESPIEFQPPYFGEYILKIQTKCAAKNCTECVFKLNVIKNTKAKNTIAIPEKRLIKSKQK